MCSKSNYLDHFNLIFDSEASTEEGEEEKEEDDGDKKKEPKVDLNTLTFEERIARYEAVCMIEIGILPVFNVCVLLPSVTTTPSKAI